MIGHKHELEEKNPRVSSQAPKGTLDLIKHDDYLTLNLKSQFAILSFPLCSSSIDDL